MKDKKKFSANDFIIVRNPITSQTLPQVNCLLQQALPRIIEKSLQNWLKIIGFGAEIFICLDNANSDVVGITVFLPINRPDDVYIEQYITEIHPRYSHFKEGLLYNLREAAKPHLNHINWSEIIIEDASTWHQMFPNQQLLPNGPQMEVVAQSL